MQTARNAKKGRERGEKEPIDGVKIGEVSESVSECTVQAFECVSVCVRVRVLNTFNILWCRLQASTGQTDTKELAETRASQWGRSSKERKGVEARKKLAS